MRSPNRASWGLAILGVAAACGDNGKTPVDGPPIDNKADLNESAFDANTLTPDTLGETGLCTNAACTTFAANVHAYTPQYTLWSDGATKKRWIYLPPGTQIDTTDMNYWKFPVGTKFWKEFTRDGTRVETRYMVKLLADDTALGAWYFVSYQWNATQDATMAVTQGVMNANGTQHDIPSRGNCRRCHENNPSRVLGFQAVALDYAGANGDLDLDHLISSNLLTTNPPGATAPHYPLPGTAVDQAAFGYLHANCGGCHNPHSAVYSTTTLELRLDVTKLASTSVVPAHVTTVNVNGTVGGLTGPIVKPSDPTNSVMIIRTNIPAGTNGRMPELGTEITDPTGQSVLTAWINQPP